jgi:cation transport regulator ChaC
MNWVFGYGSIMWDPSIVYSEVRKAKLSGWVRRFWQLSPDHRGTPARPGRVVTLVEEADCDCWGLAFRIEQGQWDKTLNILDEREKNGYIRHFLDLDLDEGPQGRCVTYIAGETNASFSPLFSAKEIILNIRQAVGPSGSNIDYFLRLRETLGHHGVCDEEIERLNQALVEIEH